MELLETVVAAARQCLSGATDLLLPEICCGCGSVNTLADGLCEPCARSLLDLVSLPYCTRCGATLGPNIPASDEGCAACPSTLPRFKFVVRLGPYAAPLRPAIKQLKYHRHEGLLKRLGKLLAEAVANRIDTSQLDVVIPVPMHWRRRLARGYDHSRAIASQIAGNLELPLGDELIRVRHTPPQVRLPRTRRLEMVRGAFSVKSPRTVSGARVLLADDVTTTGATANEAARTLLRAGASEVALAVIAKAEPPTAYASGLQWR